MNTIVKFQDVRNMTVEGDSSLTALETSCFYAVFFCLHSGPVGNVEIMCSFALHLLFCLSFSLKEEDEREKNYISKLCAWFP